MFSEQTPPIPWFQVMCNISTEWINVKLNMQGNGIIFKEKRYYPKLVLIFDGRQVMDKLVRLVS